MIYTLYICIDIHRTPMGRLCILEKWRDIQDLGFVGVFAGTNKEQNVPSPQVFKRRKSLVSELGGTLI